MTFLFRGLHFKGSRIVLCPVSLVYVCIVIVLCVYFAVVLMPPRQRMSSQRGGGRNIGHKRVPPFAYDVVASTFDVVPMEVS